VLSGGKYLTKKKPLEILRLQAMGAGEDVRLACQTFTRGDIDLEVLNLRS
jgi:ferredoxin